MNTTETLSPTTATDESPHRGRKIVAAILIVAALVAGAVTFAPNEAEASTNANVSFCFAYTNGQPAAGRTVFLYVWNGSWQVARKGTSNAKGCGVFYNVGRNRYYTVGLQEVIGNADLCMTSAAHTYIAIQGYAPKYVYTNGYGNHYVGKSHVQVHRLCW